MAITLGDAILYLKSNADKLNSGLTQGAADVQSWTNTVNGYIVKGLAAGAAVVGAALVGLGAAALSAGAQLDDAFDSIQIATGATGTELAGLKNDFRQVFADVPADAGAVSDAIAVLNQRTGASGPALQDMTTKLVQATRLMGGDAKTNAGLLSDMMLKWGLSNEQASHSLDAFFVASQQSGLSMETLLTQVTQGSEVFDSMGLSADQAAGFLARLAQNGINTDTAMVGLKTAAVKAAQSGQSLQTVFWDTYTTLQTTTDQTEALSLATEVFGTRAAPEMLAAIQSGNLAFGDMVQAMENADGAILQTAEDTADWGEKWTLIKNKATLALEPLGSILMDTIGRALDKILPMFETWAPLLGEIAAGFVRLIAGVGDTSDLFSAMADVVAMLFGEDALPQFYALADFFTMTLAPAIQDFIDGALGVLNEVITFVTENWQAFAGALGGIAALLLGGAIQSGIAAITVAVGAVSTPVLAVVAAMALLGVAWAENWGGIRDAVMNVWVTYLQPALAQLIAFLQVAIPAAIAEVKNVWDTMLQPTLVALFGFIANSILPIVGELVGWLITQIPGAFQIVADVWTSILSPALSAIFSFIRDSIIPILTTAVEWLKTNVPIAIQAASDFFNNTLLPAITAVWGFIQNSLVPLFTSLANVTMAALNVAITAMQGLWENVLLPAITAVWEFIQNSLVPIFNTVKTTIETALGPAFDWLRTTILDPVQSALGGVGGAIQGVIDFLNDLASKLNSITLPDWLTPGSPTPFEIGLRGIAKAAALAAFDIDKLGRAVNRVKPLPLPIGKGGGYIDPRAAAGGRLLLGGPAGIRRYIEPVPTPVYAATDPYEPGAATTGARGGPVGLGTKETHYHLTIQVANTDEMRDVAQQFDWLAAQQGAAA